MKDLRKTKFANELGSNSNLKVWLPVAGVAIGMLVLAGLTLRQPTSQNDLNLTAYSSPSEGYQVNFPSSWTTGDLDHGKVSKTADGVFIGSLTIATHLKTNKKFSDYIEQDLRPRVNRAGSKYQEFETVAESRMTWQRMPAYYVEFITEQANDVHADHTVLLYVDRGSGGLAALVMGVNEGEWEKNPAAYRRVIKSFKLR